MRLVTIITLSIPPKNNVDEIDTPKFLPHGEICGVFYELKVCILLFVNICRLVRNIDCNWYRSMEMESSSYLSRNISTNDYPRVRRL